MDLLGLAGICAGLVAACAYLCEMLRRRGD